MASKDVLENLELISSSPRGLSYFADYVRTIALTGRLTSNFKPEDSVTDLLASAAESLPACPEISEERFPIPNHWQWVPLASIAEHQLGKMLNKSKMTGSERPYLRSVNVRPNGTIDLSDLKEMLLSDEEFRKYSVCLGDIFVNEGGDVGRSAVFKLETKIPMTFQNALHRLRPVVGISSEYVHLVIQQAKSQGVIAEMSSGVTIQHFSASAIRRLAIPHPPISEQEEIVRRVSEILSISSEIERDLVAGEQLASAARRSAIDAISTAQTPEEVQAAWNRIEQNWEVISATAEGVQHLRKLIVDLALKGLLSRNTPDFEDRPLREVATLINGRAYKQQELLSSGTPVIRIQNLNGGSSWFYSNLDLPEDKKCVAGDLLFAWSASFGPYVWDGPESIYHYHIWKVVPNELVTRDYLYYVLQDRTEEIKSSSHGLAMLHMTKRGMEAMMIRIPSIEQQRQAVETIEKLLQICDALKSQEISKNDLAEKFSRSVALSPT